MVAIQTLVDGEFDIEGEIYVTKERAAHLRGCKEASVGVAATVSKWKRRKSPLGGHGKVYLKADVTRKHGKAVVV